MLRYIISLILCLTSLLCSAQNIVLTEDSVKGKYIPTGLRIGTDLISFTKTFVKDDFTQFVLSADVDFNRYYFNVEYGRFERGTTFDLTDKYAVEGSYFRIGPDINFLKKDPERNALFFGFRYARSSFNDQLDYTLENTFNETQTVTIKNDKLNAGWLELVTGMKVRLTDLVWLGYTARFKVGVTSFENKALIPNEIPGFGRTDRSVGWGFNYWLILRIPFRKPDKVLLDSGS